MHYDGTAIVPLVWQFWHTYRIEDLVTNILLGNRPQIFNSEWQRRIGSPIADTGNALEYNEAIAFGKAINTDELLNYMIAVGKNTREIIRSPTMEKIRSWHLKNGSCVSSKKAASLRIFARYGCWCLGEG